MSNVALPSSVVAPKAMPALVLAVVTLAPALIVKV
jgi:hypothetical protein